MGVLLCGFLCDLCASAVISLSSSSVSPCLRGESYFFCSLAHESFNPTDRFNTNRPALLSLSTTKYPCRSNWKFVPAAAPATLGSTLHPASTVSLFGFKFTVQSAPSGKSSGSGLANKYSYSRTSASTARSALTQWIVPFTFRPSGGEFPPFVCGSYVARTSTTFPSASFTTSVHRTQYAYRRRT